MDFSQKPASGALPTTTQQPPTRMEYSDEISLIDILKFFRRQLKVIGGVTVAVVLLGLGASLSTTPQARRELLLTLTLPPEFIVDPNIAAAESLMRNDVLAAGTLALSQDLPETLDNSAQSIDVTASLSSSPENNPEHLQLILVSENAAILEASEQLVLDELQGVADEAIEVYVEPEIARLDLLIQRTREKIARLEAQLASVSTLVETDSVMLSSVLQLSQQSVLAEEISKLLDYELQREGLSNLVAGNESLVSIEVLMTSQTEQSSSLVKRLILSAIAGFMISILAALIVDKWSQLRAAWTDLDN